MKVADCCEIYFEISIFSQCKKIKDHREFGEGDGRGRENVVT